MIGWLIIACEIGFWVFVLAGLAARYILKKKKLGRFLLICSPIVDLILLIATVFDIKNGAVATAVHGLAAIYIGVSIAFGPQIIQWADGIFSNRFGKRKKPDKVRSGKLHAKQEREMWYRHLLSWFIGTGILISIIFYINNHSQTEVLLHTMQFWSLILAIDFIISFSYTLFPKKPKGAK